MIKFYAKPDNLVRVPGAQSRPGQPDMYVGRNFDPERRGYFITEAGFETDENSDSGKRLLRLARLDKCLIPADKKTADLCGIEYTPVEFKSGIFVEIKPVNNNKQDKQVSS